MAFFIGLLIGIVVGLVGGIGISRLKDVIKNA